MPRSSRSLPSFLATVDTIERLVAKVLAVVTCVVIAAAIIQLIQQVLFKLIINGSTSWLGDGLIKVLGDLLTVLIALEVLQNVTSYLRSHVVQLELVLVTALTAVARKVIVLPAGSEDKPQLLIGLGIASISLAGAYWLVMRAANLRSPLQSSSRTTPAKAFQDLDPSSPHGAVDGEPE